MEISVKTFSLSIYNQNVTRETVCGDAFAWLNNYSENDFPVRSCVFTSIPDISEIPTLFGAGTKVNYDLYENWFVETISLILSKLRPSNFAIFLQSDVRLLHPTSGEVVKWIDKSYLCSIAASKTNCKLVWHKIALLNDYSMNHKSISRPQYSHLLCYYKVASSNINNSSNDVQYLNKSNNLMSDISSELVYPSYNFATPDVFYRGDMLWSKGIGINCCLLGVSFLKEIAKCEIVIDPFCGRGTVIAMANALNISSIGVEISNKRCRIAQGVNLCDKVKSMSPALQRSLGLILEKPFHKNKFDISLEVSTNSTESINHIIKDLQTNDDSNS